MPEGDSNTRLQIIIAVIGVVGVLGAAAIGNWDKLFSKAAAPVNAPSSGAVSSKPPQQSNSPDRPYVGQLFGSWKNVNPQDDGFTYLEVSDRLGIISLHIWGKCSQHDCDIGVHPVTVESGRDNLAKFDFIANTISRSGTLILLDDGKLQMTWHTKFNDATNRPEYDLTFRFVRS